MKQSRAWWQSRSKIFLDQCARLIERRIGSEALEGIFLCGSFATCEESIVLETDPPALLSDVDLVAVASSDEVLRKWAHRRSELGAQCEALLGEIRFVGRVEVGIMTRETLAAQPAKPGVYDMRHAGAVLAGPASLLGAIPSHDPGDITIGEARVLLENRAIPFLAARAEEWHRCEDRRYGFLYHIARVYTDIAVASLCVTGEYLPGYALRRDRIHARWHDSADSPLAKIITAGMVSKIERWTRYKLHPSIDTAGVGGGAQALAAVWDEAAGDLLAMWRSLDARLRACGREGKPCASAAARRGKSAVLHRWRDHLRGWRPIIAGMPAGRGAALAVALGARLLAASPLDMVRKRGMELLEAAVAAGPDGIMKGSRWGFPHATGDWSTATRQLHATWGGIVFGRASDGTA